MKFNNRQKYGHIQLMVACIYGYNWCRVIDLGYLRQWYIIYIISNIKNIKQRGCIMNINIALIGSSNSGKTTFINEMIKDINSYSPLITIAERSKEVSMHSDIINPHGYDLKIAQNQQNLKQWSFTLNDYKGSILKDREASGPGYYEFKDALNNTKNWIILIDGDCFLKEGIEAQIKAIKSSCARSIMPFIDDYLESHNNELPRIIFVVSKCTNYFLPKDQIISAVMEAFKMIIKDRYTPIIMVTDSIKLRSSGMAVLTMLCISIQESEILAQQNTSIESNVLGIAIKKMFDIYSNMLINGFDTLNIQSQINNTMPEQMPEEYIKKIPLKITWKKLMNHKVAFILDIIFLFIYLGAASDDIETGILGILIFCGITTNYICKAIKKDDATEKYEFERKNSSYQIEQFIDNKARECK